MSVLGLNIEYTLNGARDDQVLHRLTAALERAGDEVSDFRRHLWPLLVPVLEAEERRQFDAEGGGPDAGPWAPLSPGYARWKQENFPGLPILQRTRHLFEALTDSTSLFAERLETEDELEFGTRSIPYASAITLGTHSMPARAIFDLSADFEMDLQAALTQSARDAMRAARLDEYVEGL